MLDSLETQLMEAAHEAVMRSVSHEAPASGLTLVLDLRHPIAPLIAPQCGLSQMQIDAQVRQADKHGGLPWTVCWITAEGAFSLFATQGEAGVASARSLFAKARSEGSHAVALFIKGRVNVPVLTVTSNSQP